MPNPPAMPQDPLSVAIHALRTIYAGASVTGRWLTVDGEEVGQDRAEPKPGYYDRDYPPSDYDSDGWSGEGEAPAEPLRPCDSGNLSPPMSKPPGWNHAPGSQRTP